MSGYWNNTAATASTLRDGWMHSGDLGYLDPDNFIFVVDRKEGHDHLRRREHLFLGGRGGVAFTPAVAEAAVIGVPDTEWGESVKAFVVVRAGAGASAEDLIRHCGR